MGNVRKQRKKRIGWKEKKGRRRRNVEVEVKKKKKKKGPHLILAGILGKLSQIRKVHQAY